jgi:hypothetical protein
VPDVQGGFLSADSARVNFQIVRMERRAAARGTQPGSHAV